MNMNVSLPEELANFVKDKVSTGRYGSSSEVVREALRLMEKTEQQEAEKLAALREAWKEGIDSGDAGEIDFAALKKEARGRRIRQKREFVLLSQHAPAKICSTSGFMSPRTIRKRSPIAFLTASSSHVVCSRIIRSSGGPDRKFSRRRAHSSSSAGLPFIA